MLNGIQKITRRKMLWNRRAGRLKKGGLQRQREKIADEREGVKWLIFALSGARGICVTMLPHLSGLSDLTEARVIKGWERERYKKKKEGRKSASDSERHREKKTKQSGGIGMMTYWGGEIAFIHRALMNVWKSRRSKRLTLQEKWREGMRELWKGNGVKTWWGKARHDKVLNRMSLFALRSWLQPALSPCVLVREESWIEKAECGDAGKIEGSRRVRQREERGQIWVLTQLKAH